MKIDKKGLQAALLFAAVKDVRYYLNGVYFDKRGYLVATDGHRAIAIETGQTWLESFIVPSELIAKALKVSDKHIEDVDIEIDFGETTMAFVDVSIDGIKGQTIDGKYPDWEAVIPVKDNKNDYVQSPATLNPDYYMDAVKASRILLGTDRTKYKSPILFKGLTSKSFYSLSYLEACAWLNSVTCVHFGEQFTIVVMPCRI